MHPFINIAIRAARSAGNHIVRSLERLDVIQMSEKRPHDFVTEVDKQAEQIIIDTVRRNYPNHGFLAEESGEIQGDGTVWIIDPLDGTTNFIHNFPHFAVSIAISIRGRIEHGLVYDPIRHELFIASRGQGAQLNNRRLRVSPRTTLQGALLGTGFPYRYPEHIPTYIKTLQALMEQVAGIRRAGSAALDLAYVAAGRLDGFWEFGLGPWDIAAGALLIQEAGGLISDVQGTENYLESGHVVTGNPKIFKSLLQTIHAAIK
jgi:myo-inositol-1(or 4)-monophosphatase